MRSSSMTQAPHHLLLAVTDARSPGRLGLPAILEFPMATGAMPPPGPTATFPLMVLLIMSPLAPLRAESI